MVIRKFILFIFIFLPIVNSIYLSYYYLEVFMLNKPNNDVLGKMGLIILTQFFLLFLLGLVNIYLKQYEEGNLKINIRSIFVEKFTSKIVLVFSAFFFYIFIYHNLKTDFRSTITTNISILIEIIYISFAINNIRKKIMLKFFGYLIFWNCLGIMCLSVTSFFAQYLGYERLDDSNIQLVFIGVFYHLLNACFLFYNAVYKMSI